ncbi:MAG: hypothetical protein NTW21_03775 [Verrucomicrobia bacterium]|nr:hypothetical protein [Verrucomicrobiota bacterium]
MKSTALIGPIILPFRFHPFTLTKSPAAVPPPAPLSLAMNHPLAPILGLALLMLPAAARAARMPPPKAGASQQ